MHLYNDHSFKLQILLPIMNQALVPRTVGIDHSAYWYLKMQDDIPLSRTEQFNIIIMLTDL